MTRQFLLAWTIGMCIGPILALVMIYATDQPKWTNLSFNFVCALEDRIAVFDIALDGRTPDDTICVDPSTAYPANDVIARWIAKIRSQE